MERITPIRLRRRGITGITKDNPAPKTLRFALRPMAQSRMLLCALVEARQSPEAPLQFAIGVYGLHKPAGLDRNVHVNFRPGRFRPFWWSFSRVVHITVGTVFL